MTPPKNFIPSPFAYHQEVELEISNVTNLGVGVGRINNWVVMLPYVCVGEIAIARIYRNLQNYSLGDLVRVTRHSPDRVEPECQLFGICGGCQYQHMRYDTQLELKRQHVKEALERLGGINCSVEKCLCGDRKYAYRSKITPHFQKNVPPIGFLKNGGHRIVDVEKCPIATENINQALPSVRGKVLSRKGSLKKGGTLLLRDLGHQVTVDPKATVSQKIGDFEFSFCAGEFFQNNLHMLPKLVNFVTAAATGSQHLIDAYCGVGVFAIAAAKNFKSVLGVEISEIATKLAIKNAEQNNVANVNFTVGAAEQIFGNIEFPGNETNVIIDPPRSGCGVNFLEQLLAFGPGKIVYVSCAPDTQARDLKILCQKYAVELVQPFDMFPQTRHIENVAVLVKT
ncbi:MAG: class I SAM-dependent RNA methyltransferase [Puniceicoccales bacterium]|nr:class I SAM-dependent RNA methyltransferase [Puniceicoccales bacterium]